MAKLNVPKRLLFREKQNSRVLKQKKKRECYCQRVKKIIIYKPINYVTINVDESS